MRCAIFAVSYYYERLLYVASCFDLTHAHRYILTRHLAAILLVHFRVQYNQVHLDFSAQKALQACQPLFTRISFYQTDRRDTNFADVTLHLVRHRLKSHFLHGSSHMKFSLLKQLLVKVLSDLAVCVYNQNHATPDWHFTR